MHIFYVFCLFMIFKTIVGYSELANRKHISSCGNNYDADLIAWTKQGWVLGSKKKTRDGLNYLAFQGIPYAQPPIGKLRFQEPQPPQPWDCVRNATSDGNQCIQKNYLLPLADVSGSEDCLYLNVYTFTTNPNGVLKPVLVNIHGGGWFAGNGGYILNGPDYILDEDVIVVTMNYRLAVMGFFSTGDDNAVGNWGLKDQLAALKWIQNNIENFGGNAKRVTIIGQSAGGASVHYHMLSPLSTGLFHQGISASGTALSQWARPMNALSIAKQQASFVNCSTVDIREMVECIRRIDAETLVASADQFKYWSIDPLDIYSVAIEKATVNNTNPYLIDDPYVLLRTKRIANPVPWILGVVPNEGSVRAASIIANDNLRQDLNNRIDELGPKLMEVEKSIQPSEYNNLFTNLTDFYMNGEKEINNNTSKGFLDLYSDRAFIFAAYQSALRHMEIGKAPIYFYLFQYKGVYSYAPLFAGSTTYNFGVSHCDDLIYLFHTPKIFQDLPDDHPDIKMSRKLVKLWTNFVKYGEPTTDDSNASKVQWKPLPNVENRKATNSDLRYFSISNSNDSFNPVEFEMIQSLYPDRMAFWESLPISENNI